MNPQIKNNKHSPEFPTSEKCIIKEIWNSENDKAASIASARVQKGVATQWHYLKDTTERYVIIQGKGFMELGEGLTQDVETGDAVIIPAGCRQRITNTGEDDLVFNCICTPRFERRNYVEIN